MLSERFQLLSRCKGCENDDSTEERRKAREFAVLELVKRKANAFAERIGGEQKIHLAGCNCRKIGRDNLEPNLFRRCYRQLLSFGKACACISCDNHATPDRKSECRKRYCECFQAGVKCGDKCKCLDCANPMGLRGKRRSANDVSLMDVAMHADRTVRQRRN